MDATIIEDIWVLGRFLKWIYRFIRRHTDYQKIIKDATPLTGDIVNSILPFVKVTKYFSQSSHMCLVYQGRSETNEEWDILLISNKYKYLTEISLATNVCGELKRLDKELIYATSLNANTILINQ